MREAALGGDGIVFTQYVVGAQVFGAGQSRFDSLDSMGDTNPNPQTYPWPCLATMRMRLFPEQDIQDTNGHEVDSSLACQT